MKKTLVVYYSHSGNTAKVANLFADAFKADTESIESVEKYPEDYQALVKAVTKEIKDNAKPTIKDPKYDVKDYDVIVVGTPNWCGTLATPLVTYLTTHDFAGKTIIPFCSNGGGGVGNVEKDIKKYCQGANVHECIDVRGTGDQSINETIDALVKAL